MADNCKRASVPRARKQRDLACIEEEGFRRGIQRAKELVQQILPGGARAHQLAYELEKLLIEAAHPDQTPAAVKPKNYRPMAVESNDWTSPQCHTCTHEICESEDSQGHRCNLDGQPLDCSTGVCDWHEEIKQ